MSGLDGMQDVFAETFMQLGERGYMKSVGRSGQCGVVLVGHGRAAARQRD